MGQVTGEKARLEMLRNVYGSGLPARMQLDRQILDRQVARRHVMHQAALPFSVLSELGIVQMLQGRASSGVAVFKAGIGVAHWRSGGFRIRELPQPAI